MSETTTAIFDTPLNRALIGEMTGAGRKLLVLPAPAAEPAIEWADALQAADYLNAYDWIVIGDWIAADCFLNSLRDCGFELYELDSVRICAVGEPVCDRLRLDQVHADIVPGLTDPDAVAAAFDDYAGAETDARILIIADGPAGLALAAGLGKAGRTIVAETAYGLAFDKGSAARLQALFEGGAADEMVLTHPSDIIAVAALTGRNAADALAGVAIRTDDHATRRSLLENGIPPDAIRRVGK
jgi:uroporphyrinogen-III synthase